MGNRKSGSRAKRAAKPSSTLGDSNREDESRPVSHSPATKARDIISNRKSRDAKDELSKGAIKNSDTQAIKKRSSGRKKKSGEAKGQRTEPRKLNQWSPYLDQLLVLVMVYELKKLDVDIPYAAIATRIAKERGSTGDSIKQHLDKMRKRMLNQGCWVPPLNGRGRTNNMPDIRGIVQVQDADGKSVEKEVGWEDDVSSYVKPIDIFGDLGETVTSVSPERLNPTGRSAEERKVKVGRKYPCNRRKFNSSKATSASSRDVADAVDSSSSEDEDIEYHPTARAKAEYTANVRTRNQAKSNASTGGKDTPGKAGDDDGRMMDFFHPAEERDTVRKIAALSMQPSSLAQFPAGISGPGNDVYELGDVVHAPGGDVYEPNDVVNTPGGDVLEPNDVVQAPEGDFNALLTERLSENVGGNSAHNSESDSSESDSIDSSSIVENNQTFPEAGARFAMSGVGPDRGSPRFGIMAAETDTYTPMAQGRIEETNQYNAAGYPSQIPRYQYPYYVPNRYGSMAQDGVGEIDPYNAMGFAGQSFEYPDPDEPEPAGPYYYNRRLMTNTRGVPTSGSLEMSNDIDMTTGPSQDMYYGNHSGISGMGNFAGAAAGQTINYINPSLENYYPRAPSSVVPVQRANTTANGQLADRYAAHHRQTGANFGNYLDFLTGDEAAEDQEMLTDDEAVPEDQVETVTERYPSFAERMGVWAAAMRQGNRNNAGTGSTSRQ